MHMLSNGAWVSDNDSTATLTLPPSYSANATQLHLNDTHQSNFIRSTKKAWSSAPPYHADNRSIFPTAETLINPVPARPVLTRGLQVPTRRPSLTSGYSFPKILGQAGVTRAAWSAFTRDVRKHASLSTSQWAGTIAQSSGIAIGSSFLLGGMALIPATLHGHKKRMDGQGENFLLAVSNGALAQSLARWNHFYFRAKGLGVRVDIPGRSWDMEHMDLSTSRLYQYQQRHGTTRYSPYHNERSKQLKERRARTEASTRARIVILPLDHHHQPTLSTPHPRTAFSGLDGAQDDEDNGVSEVEEEVMNEDVSAVRPLLPQKDPYPDEPKP